MAAQPGATRDAAVLGRSAISRECFSLSMLASMPDGLTRISLQRWPLLSLCVSNGHAPLRIRISMNDTVPDSRTMIHTDHMLSDLYQGSCRLWQL